MSEITATASFRPPVMRSDRQNWSLPLSALLHVILLGCFLLMHFQPPELTEPSAVLVTIAAAEEPAPPAAPEPPPMPPEVKAQSPAPPAALHPVHASVHAPATVSKQVAAAPAVPVEAPADAPQPAAAAPLSETEPGQSPPSHVTSSPASPGAAISDPLALYAGKVRALLERYKRYPSEARYDKIEGTVMLRFQLGRNGSVLDWSIISSSGDASLDEEAARMLRRASPFPDIPNELGRDRLELVVPVAFSLSKSGPT